MGSQNCPFRATLGSTKNLDLRCLLGQNCPSKSDVGQHEISRQQLSARPKRPKQSNVRRLPKSSTSKFWSAKTATTRNKRRRRLVKVRARAFTVASKKGKKRRRRRDNTFYLIYFNLATAWQHILGRALRFFFPATNFGIKKWI